MKEEENTLCSDGYDWTHRIPAPNLTKEELARIEGMTAAEDRERIDAQCAAWPKKDRDKPVLAQG